MRGKAYLGFILIAGVLLASVLPVPLWAQGEYLGNALDELASPSPSPSPPKEAPSFTEMSVRMFIVLIVIIGLIILLGFFMGKFLKGRRFGAGKMATVLCVTHIVDRKYIAVVEVLGRTLIVGVGADSVALLADIGAALPLEAQAAVTPEGTNPKENQEGFSDVLADKLSTMESDQAHSFLDSLTDQVKKKISRLKE
ncbi:MAG TPA: flagellar biosynthetic protein FliO [bacterium]|nr:flagellar biosynthetic protein FliO [bacterium]